MNTRFRCVAVAASIAASVAAAPTARTSMAASLKLERVDFHAGEKSAQPSVAVDPNLGFVITWQQRHGGESALRYAVLDWKGTEQRRGEVSSGPRHFVNNADFPNLTVLDNGDWVTFWLQKTTSATFAYEVRTVRSRDQGRHWDTPLVVHRDATDTEHGFVSMVPAGDDRVRLVWLDGRKMASTASAHGDAQGEGSGEHMTLRSAVVGRAGIPSDELELDPLTCACCQTDMARGTQRTLVVYRDRSAEEIRDISVVTFAADSASGPRSVHHDGWRMAGCPVNGPALAARGDRFLAAWPTLAKEPMEVRVAVDADGEFGAPVTLGRNHGELGRVDVVAYAEGWLVSRVSEQNGKPALILTQLASEGVVTASQTVARHVLGYPRLAAQGKNLLVVFAEPAEKGESRVAVMLLEP